MGVGPEGAGEAGNHKGLLWEGLGRGAPKVGVSAAVAVR